MRAVTAAELALQMPNRWGLNKAPIALGLNGNVSACLLNAVPAEVSAPASENHILSFVVRGERRHQQWLNERLQLDGILPSNSINIIVAGGSPRAVISDPVRILHVYFPHKHFVEIAQSEDIYPSSALEIIDPRFRPDPVLHALLWALYEQMESSESVDRLWRDSISLAISTRILHRWSNVVGNSLDTSGVACGGLAPRHLRKVTDFMRENCGQELILGELAALVGLSPKHFARGFRQSTGQPPHRWLIEQRVQRAREMLAQGDLGLAEIALCCGFADQSHFTSTFRRCTGVTPGEFRRQSGT